MWRSIQFEPLEANGSRHQGPKWIPECQASHLPRRAELGVPKAPVIGVFSRLAPWKGQHVVLEALANTPGVSCIIAGSALFGEEAYEQRLRQMVRDLALGERVHFLGQRSDVPRLMRAVDAVIGKTGTVT